MLDSENMPRGCTDCEYCFGYDDSDGTPRCGYEGNYEKCPYFEEGELKINNEAKSENMDICTVNIDLNDMKSRIAIAFKNTINQTVQDEIAKSVEKEFGNKIKEYTNKILEQKIVDTVAELFAQDITIGGGWREEAVTMKREDYLIKTIGDKLESGFASDSMTQRIEKEVGKQIRDFSDRLNRSVNTKTKQLFDDVMKQTLTDSVVNLLMSNETYQQLSGSMQNLLEAGK